MSRLMKHGNTELFLCTNAQLVPACAHTCLHVTECMFLALSHTLTAASHSRLADAGFMKPFQLVHLGISNDEDEVAP